MVCCDCNSNTLLGPASSWIGPVFTRVPSKTLEILTAGRIFAPDDDIAYAADRQDVRDAAVELWRPEHVFGSDDLTEVEAAAAAASQARLRLDAAAALARHSGASWADIGRAAGMARQSAQERWRSADGAPPATEHDLARSDGTEYLRGAAAERPLTIAALPRALPPRDYRAGDNPNRGHV